MATTAELVAFRDALIKARLGDHVREFRDQNGEVVRYANDAELARALADVERRLAGAAPTAIRFTTSKGL